MRYHFIASQKAVIDSLECKIYTAKQFKKLAQSFIDEEIAYQYTLEERFNESKRDFPNGMTEFGVAWTGACLMESQAREKKWRQLIKRLEFTTDKSLNVDQARERSIEDFIEFNKANKACCIWHNEKSPSMHYYRKQNRVQCFGCNKRGDVISVVEQLHNLSFVEAVRYLNRI